MAQRIDKRWTQPSILCIECLNCFHIIVLGLGVFLWSAWLVKVAHFFVLKVLIHLDFLEFYIIFEVGKQRRSVKRRERLLLDKLSC